MSSLPTATSSKSVALRAPKAPRRAGPIDVALSDLRYRTHVRRNAAAALGFGASVAAIALSALAKRGPAKTLALSGGLSMLGGLLLVRTQLARFFTEQPPYDVEMRLAGEGLASLEIRKAHGAVMAHTFVASEMEAHDLERPIEEGFERLFAYISGQNTKSEKIEMLTPVIVRPTLGGSFVSFFMPASRTKSSLPKPSDARIEIAWAPARRVAALCYDGDFKRTDRKKWSLQLSNALRAHDIKALAEPSFAGYDAPNVLPILRRNEAWVEV
ncbi:MAG: heme-binding protein [Polyangiaceae bacterium]